jgi:hypothetical protein
MLVFSLALSIRALSWQFLPIDWNWDSYHHWQISWLSLRVGFPQWRLWDLNGCEYYWAMLPHLVESTTMALSGSPGIQTFRLLNSILGGVNAVIVYLIGRRYGSPRAGLWAGLLFAAFPIAAIFDILALQDTLALTLLLASLYTSKGRPFWSGVLLGLAGQSRTEFLLVSAVVVVWVALIDRLSTDRLPMVIGWLCVTGIASYYLYSQTGNPLYNLYWSLYNVFSSSPDSAGGSFFGLMWSWISWKLSVWPYKATGFLILTAVTVTLAYFFYSLIRRPKDYQLVYFLPTAAISAPIFLTYVGSDARMLTIMLRVVTPIITLGAPVFFGFVLVRMNPSFKGYAVILLLVTAAGFYSLLPAYSTYQEEATRTMKIADDVIRLYPGGTLVCDYPLMNYRFVTRWELPEKCLLGNHYAPQYMGSKEPIEYVKWLSNHRVTLWVRYGGDAEVVYSAVQKLSPKLLVEAYENSGIKVYLVDPVELARVLG